MENYSRVKELTEESANSAGTADQKYEAYMDSMAAATKRLENAWESFVMKLESSKILRLTSEALAGIVENIDKLLPSIISLLTAMKSSSILQFFTGGGKGFLSGGLGKIWNSVTGNRAITIGPDGQISETKTFRERVTTSLQDIKNSLHKIAYGEEPIANADGSITWNWASMKAHRKKWREMKKGDYDPSLYAEHESYLAARNSILKERGISTAMAAGVGVATRLFENRQVGGSGIASLINKTGQTVEENTGDKAIGAGLKAAGSLLGLTPLGPLGAMLGQVIGDNVADVISYLRHKDELEKKQRIAQAKENIEKLSNINSSIVSVSEEALKDNEDVDWSKLDDSIYNLYKNISEYNGDISEFISSINKLDGSVNNLTDLYDKLRSEDKKEREQAYYATEAAVAASKYYNLVGKSELGITGSQEEARENIEKTRTTWNDNRTSSISEKDLQEEAAKKFPYKKEWLDDPRRYRSELTYAAQQRQSYIDSQKSLYYIPDYTSLSIDNQISSLENYLTSHPDMDQSAKRAVEDRIAALVRASSSEKSLDKEKRDAALEAAFAAPIGVDKEGYQKYLGQYTNYELQAMGPEELYRLIAANLKDYDIDVRGSDGKITTDWQKYMRSYIQENYSAALSWDQRTLGQLKGSKGQLEAILGTLGVTESDLRHQYETGNITTNLKGYDASFIGGLLSATSDDKIESFAKAWGYTVEQLEDLKDIAPEVYKILQNLSEAQGMMEPSQVTEYYKGFSNILSDINESLSLSKDNLQNIINNYPRLLKYFSKEGSFLEETTELYRILMDEQNFVYKNAIKNAYMSSAALFGDFKDELKAQQKAIINQLSIGSFEALVQAIKQGDIKDNDILKKAYDYLNKDLKYEVENPLVSSAIEYETKMIEKQISSLEEQKAALEDVNNVREKELELIKAKQKLEEAKTNKQFVYREGVGFVAEANQEAIEQAKSEVDRLEKQRSAEQIQIDIDALNTSKAILEKLPEEKQLEALKNSFDALLGNTSGEGINGLSSNISTLATMYQNGTATVNLGEQFYTSLGLEFQKVIDKYIADKSKPPTSDEGTSTGGGGNTTTGTGGSGSTTGGEGTNTGGEGTNTGGDEETPTIDDKTTTGNKTTSGTGASKAKLLNDEKKFESNIKGGSKVSYEGVVGSSDFWGNYDFKYNNTTFSVYPVGHFWQTDEKVKKDRLNSLYGEKDRGTIVLMQGRLYRKREIGRKSGWDLLTGKPDGVDMFANHFPTLQLANPYADGTLSSENGLSLINELGTEAIITPEGTLTSLPSQTGVVPADITKNLWSLGEIAPTLVARLSSLNLPNANSNIGNTTYEEGQYIDNLTMNVYPTKDYDMDKLLSEARAQAKLTKNNH